MESTIVIKVKYRETLRRFSARVVNKEIALGINGLREKVISLFDFAPDADFKLTYIDEDGDLVTLVDEEDLRDVAIQSLNPLRITVSLNSERSTRSYTSSSRNSTPVRSPHVQHPFQNLNSGASEMFKSIPEPFRETLSKLSLDLASNATSSMPNLAELFQCLSKMRLYYLNRGAENQVGPESSSPSGISGGPCGASIVKGSQRSKVDGPAPEVNNEVSVSSKVGGPLLGANNEVLVSSKSREQTSKDTELKTINADASVGKTHVLDAYASHVPRSLKFDPGLIENALKDSINKFNATNSSMKVETSGTGDLWGKSSDFTLPNLTIVSNGESNNGVKKNECAAGGKSVGANAGASASSFNKSAPDLQTGRDLYCDSGNSSWSRACLSPIKQWPLTGMPLGNDCSLPAQNVRSMAKRSYNPSEGMGSIFHRGVQCDGCGVHPMSGPRFKSKVKEDYDLCSVCFAEMGNVDDYIRMDHPVPCRRPLCAKGMFDPVLRGCGMKPSQPRLDSHFILDVNIPDGTIMAPSTPFTKIWRMKNNGTITWPQGTQLVWIGGDKFNDMLSVEVKIPADGLAVNNELEISVDFTAPELSGRYISYWRMAAPSGQKFGQRVWVLIEVDVSLKDLGYENVSGLNLNLPPVSASTGVTGPEIINVNVEPMTEDSLPEPDNFTNAVELVAPVLEAQPNKEQELNFLVNDDSLVWGVANTNPSLAVPSSSVSYPTIDLSEAAQPAAAAASIIVDSNVALPAAAAAYPIFDLQVSAPEAGVNNDVEQTLLKELEAMGFKQVDLNKEILRMNEYDLEKSVDDLCGFSEWDHVLEELHEMGFHDNEMNRKLLKKNNGSIKRVVMDLIAGEKA